MNPPFGLFPEKVKPYATIRYAEGQSDIAAAMVQRGSSWLNQAGFVGALTTRTLLVLPTFDEWRINETLVHNQLRTVADLGYGVLDEAMVEAAAYVLTGLNSNTATFICCLNYQEKESALLSKVKEACTEQCGGDVYLRTPNDFVAFPAAVLAYWIPTHFAQQIISWPKLEAQGVSAKKGLNTSDDERLLRACWEVSSSVTGEGLRWVFIAKGGEWNRESSDVSLYLSEANCSHLA